MSSSDVQTMAGLDDHDGGSGGDGANAGFALRTPLYLIIAVFGLVIVAATFMSWAGVSAFNGSGDANSISGLDAGGWGLCAIIAGAVIAALGVLGYFWNPFSDPEAMFIAAFSAATALAALVKIFDPASLFVGAADFAAPEVGARIGLWVVLIAAIASLLSAAWILLSRPKAQARLS